jgi:hypothetical protein
VLTRNAFLSFILYHIPHLRRIFTAKFRCFLTCAASTKNPGILWLEARRTALPIWYYGYRKQREPLNGPSIKHLSNNREETKMITIERYYNDRPVNDYRMPEWVRSERYEFCEDFYESYTTDKGSAFITKLASILTALFI